MTTHFPLIKIGPTGYVRVTTQQKIEFTKSAIFLYTDMDMPGTRTKYGRIYENYLKKILILFSLK